LCSNLVVFVGRAIQPAAAFQEEVAQSHRDLAARQQYHDEAFERHDAEMRVIREAIAADAENIRALARIAEFS
jgi:hypothetical protein